MFFFKKCMKRTRHYFAVLLLFLMVQPFTALCAESPFEPNLLDADDYSAVRVFAGIRESSAASSISGAQRFISYLRAQSLCRAVSSSFLVKNVPLLPFFCGGICEIRDGNGSSPHINSDMVLRI